MNNDNTEATDITNTEEGKALRQKKKGGFAVMDPARAREISSMGGKAAHAQGRAHKFTREEAIAAGRKGGIAPHVTRGAQKKVA